MLDRQDAAAHVSLSFNQQCQRARPASRSVKNLCLWVQSPYSRQKVPDRLQRNRINSWRAMGTRTDPRWRRGSTSALVRWALYEDRLSHVKRRNAFLWHEMCFFLDQTEPPERVDTFNIYRRVCEGVSWSLTEQKDLSRYVNESINPEGANRALRDGANCVWWKGSTEGNFHGEQGSFPALGNLSEKAASAC